MKITYPECQIDISTDEVIDLLDYFEDRQPKVECRQDIGHLNMKLPELHKPKISEETKKEIEEMMRKYFEERTPTRHPQEPSFEPGGFVPDNGQLAPTPYPEASETVIPSTSEDEVSFSSAVRRFFESEEKRQLMEDKLTEQSRQRIVDCENTLEEVINGGGDAVSVKAALAGLEEAWADAENDIVPNEPAPVKSTKSPKKKSHSTKPKKVDVLFETGWKTFNSISQAAKAIDARLNHLSHALINGKTCNGHHVRYHSEMDDIMAEIQERNKEPYQTSKPVR